MRKDNWDHLLHSFIDSRAKARAPFAWGTNDCCLFVGDAIEAMTGVDTAATFRGKYSTQAGAMAQIASVTGKAGATVEDVAVHQFTAAGFKEVGVLHAQRGDAVLLEGDQGLALGIVHLNGRHALFVSAKGLNKVNISACKRAWRVQ